jgi:hypothetical protein
MLANNTLQPKLFIFLLRKARNKQLEKKLLALWVAALAATLGAWLPMGFSP